MLCFTEARQIFFENYNAAIEVYSKAIDFNNKKEEYYFYRGLAKSIINDSKGAIEDYTKSINLKPKDPLTFLERGIEKLNIRDKKGACIDLVMAVKLGLTDTELLNAKELINKNCR